MNKLAERVARRFLAAKDLPPHLEEQINMGHRALADFSIYVKEKTEVIKQVNKQLAQLNREAKEEIKRTNSKLKSVVKEPTSE